MKAWLNVFIALLFYLHRKYRLGWGERERERREANRDCCYRVARARARINFFFQKERDVYAAELKLKLFIKQLFIVSREPNVLFAFALANRIYNY